MPTVNMYNATRQRFVVLNMNRLDLDQETRDDYGSSRQYKRIGLLLLT